MCCLPVLVSWIDWLVTMPSISLRQSSRNSAKPIKLNTSRPHSTTQKQRTSRTLHGHTKKGIKESLWFADGKSPFSNFSRSTGSRQTRIYPKPDPQQKPCLVEKLDQCSKNFYQNRPYRTSTVPLKRLYLGDKVYFKHFRNNVSFWELGTITQRIGNVTYIIQDPKFEDKRHLNQIRRRTTEDLVDLPQETVEAIDTVYDTFDIEPLQSLPEPRRSGRKRKFTNTLFTYSPPQKKRY